MQQAKCTNCGVEFEVDEKQEAVVCKDCKKPVVVKDTIEEYKESLEPNTPIIKNQEVLDKVNFRLRFNLITTMIMLCYFSVVFIFVLLYEFKLLITAVVPTRSGADWACSFLEMLVSLAMINILYLQLNRI